MVQTRDLPDSPEAIVAYLLDHPDFFVKHTDILSELNIPHNTEGNIASLIEYQVAQLRQENSGLNENLERSEKDILHHRSLANAIHDLSLQLMKIDSLKKLNDILAKNLKEHYRAERFLFLVFQKPVNCDSCSNIRFLKADSKLAFMFTELFHHNKPLCNSLQTEHLEVLFEAEAESIHSTVLIPVQQSDWNGLLVLGSKMHDQYCQGFEIDLLNYITMISAAIIENIVSISRKNQQGEISS